MIDNLFKLTPQECFDTLMARFKEPVPRKIQLVMGPRQVGKTSTLLKIAKEFSRKAIYTAVDSPESSLPGYWERLWLSAREIEAKEGEAFLLMDEIQHLKDWSLKLKGEWDKIVRFNENLHVVASGSSALHLGLGSKESLAGRIERLTITHWSALALKEAFQMSDEHAALHYVTKGAYPGAMAFSHDLPRWMAYIRDAIIDPAISHDIFNVSDIRKPALLRQVFALSASSPSQIISLNKLQGQLQDKGAIETISQYLALLAENYLVAALDKYASTPIKQRSSPPKLIPLSNALPAVMDQRGIPDPAKNPERFGLWLENAIIAFFINSGQRAYYWREKDFEVDAVIEGSWGNFAIEVKSSVFTEKDLAGLFHFTNKFPKFKPLLICDKKDLIRASRLNIKAIDWESFLLFGLINR